MDFGDIIYVVLAIVFSAAGALGKRKKRQPQVQKPSRVQELFNQIFEEEINDDPVQQVADYSAEEQRLDKVVGEVEELPLSLMDEYQSMLNKKIVGETATEVIALEESDETLTPQKPHRLLADLKNRNELQKAFVYSEVFKPKFKTL